MSLDGSLEPTLNTEDWIGRTDIRTGCLTPNLAGMLAAALGHRHAPKYDTRPGAPLGRLWHWAAFPEFVPMAELGADGHPALGGFLPPLEFRRRMWAGGKLRFEGGFEIGEHLHRVSTIRAITRKEGKTGPMAFVTVEHVTTGDAGGAVIEEQNIVYLDIPDTFRPPQRVAAPLQPVFDERVEINEVRLFRYSAATYNAHRIHYDLPYAQLVEKYPGLVVHGPMQATLALNAAERHTRRTAKRFSYRVVHPMFHDQDMRLVGAMDPDGQAIDIGTATDADYLGLQARMEWGT